MSLKATGKENGFSKRAIRFFSIIVVSMFGVGCAHNSKVIRPEAPRGQSFMLYRVKQGDSLGGIADEYRVPAQALGTINDLSDLDQIQVNQRLWIPRRKFSLFGRWSRPGVYLRMSKGDTIAELARKYGSEIKLILKYNRIRDPRRLQPGRLLFIPRLKSKAPVRTVRRSETKTAAGTVLPRKDDAVLAWPIRDAFTITSRYGQRNSRPHKGIDLAAPRGTPIYAAESGVVIVASHNLRGYGKTVVIMHSNGLRTVYAHADRILVKMGQQVVRGQKIAEVGCTGRSTGFHLHFEVRKGTDKTVDPLKYLSKLGSKE